MFKVKVSKQDAEKLLADVAEDRSFWCNDGQVFRNMRDLADGLSKMSDQTFAYHSNEEKRDFSNWLKDVIEDEKLAEDLESSAPRKQAARLVNERIKLLDMKLS